MSKRDGFSLFELLLVLALLAVMGALALQGVRTWSARSEVDRANGVIVELISEAKLRAVRDGVPWIVRYSHEPRSLVIAPENPGRLKREEHEIRSVLGRSLEETIQIVFVSAGSGKSLPSIRVTPLGSMTPAIIHVLRSGVVQQSFRIDRLTGSLKKIP